VLRPGVHAMTEAYDVGIVGGGPAGLSAALVLGRCRRRTVVFDAGTPRNHAAHAMHAFLTRDGIAPNVLRQLARAELARYPSVEIRDVEIADAARDGDEFVLRDASGATVRSRALLLATGLVDRLPEVEGAAGLVGHGLHHCPYCDGWEHRDQPVAVYAGADDGAADYALTIRRWTDDVVVCTDGPSRISGALATQLDGRGVAVDPRPVVRMARDGDGVRIDFDRGPPVWRRAVFFHLGSRPRSDLAARLGCALDDRGGVVVTRLEASTVPRLYVAGDASRDVLLAVVAAGEGAAAAVMIDRALG
jgi:thioredoxin reductase